MVRPPRGHAAHVSAQKTFLRSQCLQVMQNIIAESDSYYFPDFPKTNNRTADTCRSPPC